MHLRLLSLLFLLIFQFKSSVAQDWLTYAFGSPIGLNGHIVTSISSDNAGNLWFGTDQGVYRHFLTYGLWTHYKNIYNSTIPVYVNRISKDNLGRIWVATNNGLAFFNTTTGNFVRYSSGNGLPSDIIKDVISTGTINPSYWIATYGGGLCRLQGNTFSIINSSHGLAGNFVYRVCRGVGSDLWIGTTMGLSMLHNGVFTNYTINDGLPSNNIISIAAAPDGTMWFGTLNGAVSFNGTQWQTWNTSNGLAGNIIYDIHCGSNNTIWFATDMGISTYDGTTFFTYNTSNGPSDNTILAIHERLPGELWFGLGNGSASVLNQSVWQHISNSAGTLSGTISAITQDTSKAIWISTLNNGLYLFRNSQWEHFSVANSTLPTNIIKHACADASGNVWFASDAGLIKYSGNTFTTYNVSNGLISNQVNFILKDRQNKLWCGTNNGLSRINPNNTFENYNSYPGMVMNKITKMACDYQNRLWLYHDYNQNLTVFDGAQFSPFLKPEMNNINQPVIEIFADKNGRIWAWSNYYTFFLNDAQVWLSVPELNIYGISKMQHTNDDSYWFGYNYTIRRKKGINFVSYSSLSGVNIYGVSAMFSDADGWLWIAHNNGISINHPDLIPLSAHSLSPANNILVYPNPFNENFKILSYASEISGIELYNLSGLVVYQEFYNTAAAPATEITLHTAQIPSGIYILKLFTPQSKTITLKIVKTK